MIEGAESENAILRWFGCNNCDNFSQCCIRLDGIGTEIHFLTGLRLLGDFKTKS